MSKYDDIFITDPGYKAIADKADADWQAAYEAGDEEGMARAHKTKEEVRAMYGYSGGEDGGQYVRREKPKTNEKPSYVSGYDEIMAKAVGQVLNRGPFTYDHEKDPSYHQYADAYTRMGRQAMEDTLGKVSARTGGLASSYATTAAQQTYNGYMAELADKVPELRQLAYQMYMDEGNEQRQNLQLLQNLEQIAYGRHRDTVADSQWQQNFDRGVFESDRNYNYGVQRDQIADGRYDTEWDYKVGQDTYNREQDEKDAAREQILQALTVLGMPVSALDQKLVDLSGYDQATLTAMEKFYKDNQKVTVTGSGGGGGDNSMTLATAKAMAKQGQFTDDVLRVLRNAGFNDEYLKLEYGYEPESVPDGPTAGTPISQYGTSYSSIWSRARTMFDQKKSADEIMKFLDKFSPTQLTDAGLDYIMNSLNLNGYRNGG